MSGWPVTALDFSLLHMSSDEFFLTDFLIRGLTDFKEPKLFPSVKPADSKS